MALIDQDELLEKVKKRKELTVKELDGIPKYGEVYARLIGEMGGVDRVRQIIEEMPTIEQPKKGHWEKAKYADDRWHQCSECGTATEAVDHNGYKLICNYCPVCGADMRGGKE